MPDGNVNTYVNTYGNSDPHGSGYSYTYCYCGGEVYADAQAAAYASSPPITSGL